MALLPGLLPAAAAQVAENPGAHLLRVQRSKGIVDQNTGFVTLGESYSYCLQGLSSHLLGSEERPLSVRVLHHGVDELVLSKG